MLVFVVAQQVFGDGGSVIRAVVIVLVMAAALTVRRRWPTVAFGAALLMVAVATTGLEFLAIASYTLVAHRQRAHPVVVGGTAVVAMLVGFVQYWPAFTLEVMAGDLILIAGVAVLPAAFGQAVRASRRTTTELEARNAELVALRQQQAAHAVEGERFRIARELHDVVAHHVSAMTVRARAGRHVASRDPGAAEEALAYIASTGTETLTAMGAFVGTLRGQQTSSGPEDVSPQPSLDDVAALLESFRGAGLVVHAEFAPPPVPIASTTGLNAYRIVQEALTNAIRHGAAERAWVRIWLTNDRLHIQIDDNGRGLAADAPAAGHGLVGIAERAGLNGGSSEFGPSPRGGCRLKATLHVEEAAGTGPGPVDASVTAP